MARRGWCWDDFRPAGQAIVVVIGLLVLDRAGAAAQSAPEAPPRAPPQVEELVRLLADPTVREWLERNRTAIPAEPTRPDTPPTRPAVRGGTVSFDLPERLEGARAHLRDVAAAIPRLPEHFSEARRRLVEDVGGDGRPHIPLLLFSFVAIGLGLEALFRRSTLQLRRFVDTKPIGSATQRLIAVALRTGLQMASVAVFAVGSLGAFLLLPWPALLKHVVVGYLTAVIGFRIAQVLLDGVLARPRAELAEPERFRLLPISSEAASYWYWRIAAFVGWFAFGGTTIHVLTALGFPSPASQAVAYVFGIGLLVIGLEALWRRPLPAEAGATRHYRSAENIGLTAYALILWSLWVGGFPGLFWLTTFAGLLPSTIALSRQAVTHLMRSVDGDEAPTVNQDIRKVCIDSGIRFVLIAAAVLWLAHVLGIDLVALTSPETGPTRLVRGALTGIVVLLLADLLWQIAKAAIDAKLRVAEATPEANDSDAVRKARLRTLLPVFRNMLMALIGAMALLTAIASLGIDVAPLIAGAGVFGVAIGFGSQALVRDIISGIFYLLDDAFRVGDYIQSGSYKGTVESFSLRSVRLRHHRGPLYTIPFGQLGAVQNMSRDWVIDKIRVGVTYDTDIETARKLIKKIGQELAADPEYADKIIEPMKMQGIERFGDYAIEIGIKMMTKPGEQYTIRRKAHAKIKLAFDAAGIKFAFPTVQVAEGGEAAAIAHHAMQARAALIGATVGGADERSRTAAAGQ